MINKINLKSFVNLSFPQKYIFYILIYKIINNIMRIMFIFYILLKYFFYTEKDDLFFSIFSLFDI